MSDRTVVATVPNGDEAVTERDEDALRRLAGYLVAVENLHAERHRTVDGYTLRWCRECDQDWPCPTVEACHGR